MGRIVPAYFQCVFFPRIPAPLYDATVQHFAWYKAYLEFSCTIYSGTFCDFLKFLLCTTQYQNIHAWLTSVVEKNKIQVNSKWVNYNQVSCGQNKV